MNRNNKQYLFYIIIFLLGIWVLISISRTAYNLSKVLTEQRDFFSLSEYKKKEKIFGDIFVFLSKIKTMYHSNQFITIITDDERMYYYNKYVLYPIKSEVIEIENLNLNKVNNPSLHVVVFVRNEKLLLQIEKQLFKRGYAKNFYFTGSKSFGSTYIKK